jgi:Thioredoxin-like
MYPHERSLVEKFQGRPFAIVGINSDEDRENIKEVIAKEKLAWRSFWDGGSKEGPIAQQWNVQGWPTVYLIDHNGKIILPAMHGLNKEHDELIEAKVKEAEAGQK